MSHSPILNPFLVLNIIPIHGIHAQAKQLSILVGLRIQSNLMEHLRDGRPVLPGIQPRSGTQM